MASKTIRDALMNAAEIILVDNGIEVTKDKKELLYHIMMESLESDNILDDIRESDDEDIKLRLTSYTVVDAHKKDDII